MSRMHNQRGDTIVEVLIALTVLTLILVGAFATASRSQNMNRASQERGEAMKVIESQIESLKGVLTSTPSPGNQPPAGAFCINQASSSFVALSQPADPFSESLESATLPYQPANCGDILGRYNVAIKFNASTNTYEFIARWFRVGGGKDQINMYYRTY